MIGQFATGTVMHNLIVGTEYSNLQVANGTYDLTANGATNCLVSGRGGLSPNYCITDENRNVIFGDDQIHNLIQRDIVRGDVDSNWQVETLSVYAMDTVDFTDWLSVHGGIRMDAFSYSNVVDSRGTVTAYTYSDTLWNGHAGIGVKPMEEVYVYFNYGTAKNINGGESDLGGNCGYGGICVDDGTGIGDGSPESSESFELGVKADLFDDRFMLTAAAFQITKGDVFESAGDGYSAGGSLNTARTASAVWNSASSATSRPSCSHRRLTVMESEITES